MGAYRIYALLVSVAFCYRVTCTSGQVLDDSATGEVQGMKGEMQRTSEYTGIKGPKGDPGYLGAPGMKGEMGNHGYPGMKGAKGVSGFPGAPGMKGEMGNHGYPGMKGSKGDAGFPGGPGIKGDRGDNDFPGRPGPALETFTNEIIESVRQRLQEPPQGEPMNYRNTPHRPMGYVIRHSQSSVPPSCPPGSDRLWTGYSFLASDEVRGAALRDVSFVHIGTTVSCLPRFTSSHLLHCDTGDRCATSSSVSNWLSDLSAENQAGRCTVCHIVNPPIAVHSQSTEIPECPTGWIGLWAGYTFVSKSKNYELASPGSCVEKYKYHPLIECTEGQCATAGTEGLWMAAVVSHSQKPTADSQGNRTEPISRCQVCAKNSV